MKREFNDEQLMGLGRLVASLFDMRAEGEAMIERMAAEAGVTLEEAKAVFQLSAASSSFEMKDDGVTYELTLDVYKTDEERLLEMLPEGSEVFAGGLIAVPDPVEDED
jgi:hypothetical protein